MNAIASYLADVLVGPPLPVARYTVRNCSGIKVLTCGSLDTADHVARQCAQRARQYGPYTIENEAGREIARYA